MLAALASLILAGPTSVTVPMILEGNAPMVELEFQTPAHTVRKAKFLVDTGGGAFIMGAQLVKDLGLKFNGPAQSEDGSSYAPLPTVPAKLGGMDLNFEGVRTMGLVDDIRMMSRNTAEGLFPATLLRHYDVGFNYPKRRFTLALPGVRKPVGTKLNASISPRSAFPRVEVTINGQAYGVLLDTGASYTMISKANLDGWSQQNPAWPNSVGAVGFANMFGGPTENDALLLRIPSVKIGDAEVRNSGAVARPIGTFEKYMSGMMTAPIIGSIAGNLLKGFQVEIDYPAGNVYISRPPAPPTSTGPDPNATDPDTTTVGLVLAGEKGDLIVTGISSAAADDVKSQVQPLDVLLAVNGVPQKGRCLAQAAVALAGEPGSQKELTLLRKGKSVKVKVTVKRLL